MPGSIRWKGDSNDNDAAALKYVIARKVLIQHLRRYFAESKAGAHETAVHVFGGLDDEAFKTYLDEKTVRYVFCHSGFDDQDDRKKELLHEVIYQLVSDGYHVALLDNVTFQSSKVCFAKVWRLRVLILTPLDLRKPHRWSHCPAS
jgi:hypothetical protein